MSPAADRKPSLDDALREAHKACPCAQGPWWHCGAGLHPCRCKGGPSPCGGKQHAAIDTLVKVARLDGMASMAQEFDRVKDAKLDGGLSLAQSIGEAAWALQKLLATERDRLRREVEEPRG